MTGAVVVAGEALIDLVPEGPEGLIAHPGGGPFNAARAAARLEAPAAFLGRLSTDAFGARLRATLVEDGVDLGPAVTTDDPSTLALVELDAAAVATYRFYTDGTSAPGLRPEDVRLPDRVDVLVAGTLGLVFDPSATTIEGLVTSAAPDTLVVVDPNCRPAAIRDPAGYRARLERVLARADVVKVSEEDLAWLAPGVGVEEAARALGAPVALVTLGGDGALALSAGEPAARVPASPARVVDTIGAGDAFVGAIAARLRGVDRAAIPGSEALLDAVAFACRVAARACERAGADPPRLSEL
jgi:fructokinase